MPNISTVKVSTAGKTQFKALQYEMSLAKLDTTCANEAIIYFRNGILLSLIGTIRVDILVGMANFHVVNTSNPFLLCLKNINTLEVYLNNITNQLIYQDGKNIPILCKWGHP